MSKRRLKGVLETWVCFTEFLGKFSSLAQRFLFFGDGRQVTQSCDFHLLTFFSMSYKLVVCV